MAVPPPSRRLAGPPVRALLAVGDVEAAAFEVDGNRFQYPAHVAMSVGTDGYWAALKRLIKLEAATAHLADKVVQRHVIDTGDSRCPAEPRKSPAEEGYAAFTLI